MGPHCNLCWLSVHVQQLIEKNTIKHRNIDNTKITIKILNSFTEPISKYKNKLRSTYLNLKFHIVMSEKSLRPSSTMNEKIEKINIFLGMFYFSIITFTVAQKLVVVVSLIQNFPFVIIF